MKVFENKEIPSVVFRRLLPFISSRDMKNVEIAVMPSPALYNEYSCYTKKHSRQVYPDSRLICPYCLISGGFFNPWHKMLMAIYRMNPDTWELGQQGVALFRSGPYILVEAETIEGMKARLPKNASSSVLWLPENRFRRWTQIWAEEKDRNEAANKLLLALRDVNVYNTASQLVTHIETAHHPSGEIWKKTNIREQVRAHELDELTSLIMAKQFVGSIISISPRKNKEFHENLKSRASRRKRRYRENPRFMNPPATTMYIDRVQNVHRTLALCYLLEDNLQRNTRTHLVIRPKLHKLLALRDYLACQVEVFERIEFDDLPQDNAVHFGIINAIKLILDSILQIPY